MSDEREMTLREYINSRPIHDSHLIVRQLDEYEVQAEQIEQLKKENDCLRHIASELFDEFDANTTERDLELNEYLSILHIRAQKLLTNKE